MVVNKVSSKKRPLLFTPGPVMMSERTLKIAGQQLPYNRTQNFSELTYEIIDGLKYVFQTQGDVAILTASGTGAMEASVLNFLKDQDKALVVNGGGFGARWGELCKSNDIAYEEFAVSYGDDLDLERLENEIKQKQITAILMQSHETSTGVLYNIKKVGELAKQHNVLLIIDAISSVCCDPFMMDEWNIDVAILSSQKALALSPGLSFVAMSDKAKARLKEKPCPSLYFDLKNYLKNQERGQMPYSPAISLFLMLHDRLKEIQGLGIDQVIAQHRNRADYFRSNIKELPFGVFSKTPSSAMTALQCMDKISAKKLVQSLEKNYQIYVAPNGGDLETKVFRVSHMGEQSLNDLDDLISVLHQAVQDKLWE